MKFTAEQKNNAIKRITTLTAELNAQYIRPDWRQREKNRVCAVKTAAEELGASVSTVRRWYTAHQEQRQKEYSRLSDLHEISPEGVAEAKAHDLAYDIQKMLDNNFGCENPCDVETMGIATAKLAEVHELLQSALKSGES